MKNVLIVGAGRLGKGFVGETLTMRDGILHSWIRTRELQKNYENTVVIM